MAIVGHIAVVEAQERAPDFELQSERADHAFAESRRKVFVGRDSNRAAIASYMTGSRAHAIVIGLVGLCSQLLWPSVFSCRIREL